MSHKKSVANRKRSEKQFVLEDPLLDARFWVQVGGDEVKGIRKWKAFLKRQGKGRKDALEILGEIEEKETCHVAYVMSIAGFKEIFIYFRNECPGAGVVAHECLHAAWRIVEMSSMQVCKENEELVAYYLEWLVKGVGKRVW